MTTARLARESSERSRALALIQETKRKQLSDSVTATPGSLAAGRSEYGDQWNAAEVREAKRRKDAVRGWARGVGGASGTDKMCEPQRGIKMIDENQSLQAGGQAGRVNPESSTDQVGIGKSSGICLPSSPLMIFHIH